MLRPNFEDPLDTATQLVENNITLYSGPYNHIWKQFMETSPITEYNKLAETYVITKSYDEFDQLTEFNVMKKGTHAYMAPGMPKYVHAMGRWYRSKEMLNGAYGYGGYLSNKKWYLNAVG